MGEGRPTLDAHLLGESDAIGPRERVKPTM